MQDRKIYHLILYNDHKWHLKSEVSKSDISIYDTKEQATIDAKNTAKNNEPSRLLIHRENGTVKVLYTYG